MKDQTLLIKFKDALYCFPALGVEHRALHVPGKALCPSPTLLSKCDMSFSNSAPSMVAFA
jgi:hypothetical protein